MREGRCRVPCPTPLRFRPPPAGEASLRPEGAAISAGSGTWQAVMRTTSSLAGLLLLRNSAPINGRSAIPGTCLSLSRDRFSIRLASTTVPSSTTTVLLGMLRVATCGLPPWPGKATSLTSTAMSSAMLLSSPTCGVIARTVPAAVSAAGSEASLVLPTRSTASSRRLGRVYKRSERPSRAWSLRKRGCGSPENPT